MGAAWERHAMCESAFSVVCCQAEVFASACSLVQRRPSECGVSEYDRDASMKGRPCSTRRCCLMGGPLERQHAAFNVLKRSV
jgi:hypothetical protein